MKVFIFGLPYDEAEEAESGETPEQAARAECEHSFGTADGCLVVDVLGKVMLNTTGVEVEKVVAS